MRMKHATHVPATISTSLPLRGGGRWGWGEQEKLGLSRCSQVVRVAPIQGKGYVRIFSDVLSHHIIPGPRVRCNSYLLFSRYPAKGGQEVCYWRDIYRTGATTRSMRAIAVVLPRDKFGSLLRITPVEISRVVMRWV